MLHAGHTNPEKFTNPEKNTSRGRRQEVNPESEKSNNTSNIYLQQENASKPKKQRKAIMANTNT